MVIFDPKEVEVNTCHIFWGKSNDPFQTSQFDYKNFSSISKIFSHCALHKIATSAKTINNGLVL